MLQALPFNLLFTHNTPAVASEALCVYYVGVEYLQEQLLFNRNLVPCNGH